MPRSSRRNFLSVTSVGSLNQLCAGVYPLSFAMKASRLRWCTIHAHDARLERRRNRLACDLLQLEKEQPSAQPQGEALVISNIARLARTASVALLLASLAAQAPA